MEAPSAASALSHTAKRKATGSDVILARYSEHFLTLQTTTLELIYAAEYQLMQMPDPQRRNQRPLFSSPKTIVAISLETVHDVERSIDIQIRTGLRDALWRFIALNY